MSTRITLTPVAEGTSSEHTALSRVVIELDAIRHTLGKRSRPDVPFGTRSDFICTARFQVAALRLIVIRAAQSELRSRLLELIDRMETEIENDPRDAQ